MGTPTAPDPMPAPPEALTLQCTLGDAPAAVQWQRRLTDAEFQPILDAEQARRDEILLLADPTQPPPVFGPMPDPSDYTIAVYACAAHGISLDLAARIHQATCTAPAVADLPGCNCSPEPTPEPTPEADRAFSAARPLPDHWVTG
ncbi:hypothetical protein [Streptomyces sp. NPDC019937]|uniref:hypothetical protein n=1 Tax=Streptomyces sp. NPDC019937 TaxID=3154787 RepID=UPI0033E01908